MDDATRWKELLSNISYHIHEFFCEFGERPAAIARIWVIHGLVRHERFRSGSPLATAAHHRPGKSGCAFQICSGC
jgi:hypothetical protein